LRGERCEQLLAGVEHVAGAEREHEVAGPHARREAGHYVAQAREERDRAARALGEVRVDDELAADARLGLLTRGEDLGDDRIVGKRKRTAELTMQVQEAREKK
jgi:hypothetical protein